MNPNPVSVRVALLIVGFVVTAVALGCGSGPPASDTASGEASGSDDVHHSNEMHSARMMARPADSPAPIITEDMLRRADVGDEDAETATKPDAKPKAVQTWERSGAVPNATRVEVGGGDPLPLVGTHTTVRIDGFRARVLTDVYFHNDRDRGQLEGTFKLRLPNGATPFYLAFGGTTITRDDFGDQGSIREVQEVDWRAGKLTERTRDRWTPGVKEARMAPRELALQAYRATVVRRVDPALLEWSGAGMYSARLYPLAAKTIHRVVFGYDVDLVRAGDGYTYVHGVPEQDAPQLIDMVVGRIEGEEITFEPEPKREPLVSRKRVMLQYENPDAKAITVTLLGETTVATVLVGDFEPTGGAPQPVFAAEGVFPGPTAGADADVAPRGVLAIDCSLSSAPDAYSVWLKLAEEILTANRDQMREFAVLFFNVESWWWRPNWVANTSGNVATMLRDAREMALEGATDLETALRKVAGGPTGADAANAAEADLFLLSDGGATWGEANGRRLIRIVTESAVRALFAYRTGAATGDPQLLDRLAGATGGAAFRVAGDAEVARAATAHRFRPIEVISVDLVGGEDVQLAGDARFIYPGARIRVVGRGVVSDDTPITLRLAGTGVGDDATMFTLPVASIRETPLAVRAYGEAMVRTLEEWVPETQSASTAYAITFRVPGQTCSMVMLESDADYARFGLTDQTRTRAEAFVAQEPALPILDRVQRIFADAFGNGKVEFVQTVRRLKQLRDAGAVGPRDSNQTPPEYVPTRNENFDLNQISEALAVLVDRMPASAFEIRAEPLRCELRRADDAGDLTKKINEAGDNRSRAEKMIDEAVRDRLNDDRMADALRAASSLIEIVGRDPQHLSELAFRLMDWRMPGQACRLLHDVVVKRPNQLQTYHLLARALGEAGMTDLAFAWYEVGFIAGAGNTNFMRQLGIDYAYLLHQAAEGRVETATGDFAPRRLIAISRGLKLADLDIVVSIAWSTNRTDVDLHMFEPAGEHCFYGNRETKAGGRLSHDDTDGYGPETYENRDAFEGEYKPKIVLYDEDAVRPGEPVRVYVTIIANWGRPNQSIRREVVTLHGNREEVDLEPIRFVLDPKPN
jgi:hypothetical protein